jgi:chaperone required for assembly of F1-ATPase
MRDIFEAGPSVDPVDPVEASRRNMRPSLRQRFYRKAHTKAVPGGHLVCLDDAPIHTPARREFAAPTAALAKAIAAEWDAQQDLIDPTKMPLTRLANAIIDDVADASDPVAAEIRKYLASDLLFYRVGSPKELRERQLRHWDPILTWADHALGVKFRLGEGIVHVAQPEAAIEAAATAIPANHWRLGAVHVITSLTGSALIALAMARGALSAEAAWKAAHVDEDWNIEQWGCDQIALKRRSFRFAELQAAATVLEQVGGQN